MPHSLSAAAQIGATIALDAAVSTLWEVLVIGAGPAGALAAREAARAGRRVLFVDGRGFPRSKVCGGCLNGQALAVLKSVGLESLPQALGGIALDHFDVRSSRRGVRLALPAGIAVSRFHLDAALIEVAIDAGAEFLPQTTAALGDIGGLGRDEHRAVHLQHHDGTPRTARARVVLAADGLAHASLRDRTEFRSRVDAGARIGLGAQIAEYPAAYSPGTIYMAVGPHGYVGLVVVEEGLLNMAAALDPDFVKAARGPPAALAAILDEAGFPAIAALPRGDWQGTLPLTRRTTPAAARRVLLLGDAAGYVEPFTGEGMAWAFAAAAAAPPLIERGLWDWAPALEREWRSTLRAIVFRRQRWCRRLAFALRHPLAIDLALWSAALVPSLADRIVRSLNKPPNKGVRNFF